MLTRKTTDAKTALIAGLVAGLVSQVAVAQEEVVAYGGHVAEQLRTSEAEFRSRTSESARSLHQDVEANVTKELTQLKTPKLELALSEAPTRG